MWIDPFMSKDPHGYYPNLPIIQPCVIQNLEYLSRISLPQTRSTNQAKDAQKFRGSLRSNAQNLRGPGVKPRRETVIRSAPTIAFAVVQTVIFAAARNSVSRPVLLSEDDLACNSVPCSLILLPDGVGYPDDMAGLPKRRAHSR